MDRDDGIVVPMQWIYILRCSDGSLSVGHTDNVAAGEARHNEGHASRYTSRRRPVKVVYTERHVCRKSAIARERQLKRSTAYKKEALIAGDLQALKSLSMRRGRSRSHSV
jgi:predicted GIY-YIG superfamily endonuclease